MRIFQHPRVFLLLPAALSIMTVGCYRPIPPASSAGLNSTAPTEDDSQFPSDVTWPGATQPGDSAVGESTGDSETLQVAQLPPGAKLAPIPIELPAPAFRGTPVPLTEPNVEQPRGKPRDPFLAPEGTVNLALGQLVTCNDPAPNSGELDLVTDGDKEATDFGCLELHPGTAWVQVDLGQPSTIWAVVVWHNHAQARVYRDVIVQISDDPDFLDAVTVFNNDYDNTSGQGIGSDMGYVETSEGKLINCRGYVGRYIRLYSNGNTTDPENHYTEVEVYGIPAP